MMTGVTVVNKRARGISLLIPCCCVDMVAVISTHTQQENTTGATLTSTAGWRQSLRNDPGNVPLGRPSSARIISTITIQPKLKRGQGPVIVMVIMTLTKVSKAKEAIKRRL